MLIIGENINATRKKVADAIKQRNVEFITDLAEKQVQSGVDFIDVNAGSGYSDGLQKQAAIQWMIETLQTRVDVPLVIDSDEPELIGAALEKYQGERVLINSVTDENESLEATGKLAASCGAWLVGLALPEAISHISQAVMSGLACTVSSMLATRSCSSKVSPTW